MQTIHRILSVSLLLILSACDSDNARPTSATELSLPHDIRQIATIDYSDVFADIVVNGGEPQTFRMSGGDSVIVNLADVLRGEQNDITILWYEVTDGVQLNLATQTGAFLATTDATFDSPHVSAQFDADADGLSNLAERSAATCPWLYCAADGRSPVDPRDVTGVTGVTSDSTITASFALSSDNLWQENVAPDNLVFSWSATRYSATSIFLQDNQRCSICNPYRGWLLEINLATGELTFDYNDDVREPVVIYRIEELTF